MKIELTDEVVKAIESCKRPISTDCENVDTYCPLFGACLEYYTGDDSANKEEIGKMRKLIVHETDVHGNGYVQYNGNGFDYSYDSEYGNVRGAVWGLIELGFIERDDVLFIDGDEIYEILDKALADK